MLGGFVVRSLLPDDAAVTSAAALEDTLARLRAISQLTGRPVAESIVLESAAALASVGHPVDWVTRWGTALVYGDAEVNGEEGSAHPLLYAEFSDFALADRAVRAFEMRASRDMTRARKGHGTNSNKAVLLCKAGCAFDSVHYVLRRLPSGKWRVDQARSAHADCIPSGRALRRMLRGSDVIRASITSTMHNQSSLRALQTLAAAEGLGVSMSTTTASRLRRDVLREYTAGAQSTTEFLPEFVHACVAANPGSYALIKLGHTPRGGRSRGGGASAVRHLTYKSDASGSVTKTDTHMGEPIVDAQLKQLLFVPGTSAQVLRAVVPVLSVDYGRNLYKEGGGVVVVVGEAAEVLIPLAMNLCEIETAESWGDAVFALADVGGAAAQQSKYTVLGDRFAGADAALGDSMPAAWERAYCVFHLLLNSTHECGAMRKEDEHLFWATANARNEKEFADAWSTLGKAYPKHVAYLSSIPTEKWVFCRMAAQHVFVGRTRASRAELEFARGRKNASRMRRGADVLTSFLKSHADLLSRIKHKVATLHEAGRALMPKAKCALDEALERSTRYVADHQLSRRSSAGVPEAGHVRYIDAANGELTHVDTVCAPSMAANVSAGVVARGDTGATGYCAHCHQPDARGEVCAHLARFVIDAVRPRPEEREATIAALFHRCYRVTELHSVLEGARECVVPSYHVAERRGHGIAPLLGKRGPGRPPKERGKPGRKPKETERIRSNGEVARLEASAAAKKARLASSS